MAASAATLSTAVKARVAEQRLVELTNYTGSGSAIDDDVLTANCNDAIGEFRILSGGIEADTDNTTHLQVLVTGVMYFLEYYKGRDAGILSFTKKMWISKCKAIADLKTFLPESNSVLQVSSETNDAMPDFDRKQKVWRGGRRINRPDEQAVWNDS